MEPIHIDQYEDFLDYCKRIRLECDRGALQAAIRAAEEMLSSSNCAPSQKVNVARLARTLHGVAEYYRNQDIHLADAKFQDITLAPYSGKLEVVERSRKLLASRADCVAAPPPARTFSYDPAPFGDLLVDEMRTLFNGGGFQIAFRESPINIYLLNEVRLAYTGGDSIIVSRKGEGYEKLPDGMLDVFSPEYYLSRGRLEAETNVYDLGFLVRPVGGSNFFFHFCQVISVLAIYKKLNLSCLIVFLEPPSKAQWTLLRHAGIPEERLPSRQFLTTRFRRALVCRDSYYWDRDQIEFFRGIGASLAAALETAGTAPDIADGGAIYISRRRSKLRPMVNEAALEEALAARGVAIVFLEDHTIEQQVAIVRKARFIIGPHGAGFAHLIFSPPGTTVLELFAPDYAIQSFYQRAVTCGHRYFPYLGRSMGDFDNEESMKWEVDIARVLRIVEAIDPRG